MEGYFATWAELATGIELRFATTLAAAQYSISDFVTATPRETDDGNYIVSASGTIAFPYAQNDPFRPVVVAVSAFLRLGAEHRKIRIIGHDQLAFRIREESQTLLSSGWPRMDAHVHDMLQKLCTDQPSVRDELKTLSPLLNALTAVLGTFAHGGVLKGRTDVSEAEFQAEALKLLRMSLGEDVQEGPKQAGGITDIRFRGCIVELKIKNLYLGSRSTR